MVPVLMSKGKESVTDDDNTGANTESHTHTHTHTHVQFTVRQSTAPSNDGRYRHVRVGYVGTGPISTHAYRIVAK